MKVEVNCIFFPGGTPTTHTFELSPNKNVRWKKILMGAAGRSVKFNDGDTSTWASAFKIAKSLV
jgi:hypothetical protein